MRKLMPMILPKFSKKKHKKSNKIKLPKCIKEQRIKKKPTNKKKKTSPHKKPTLTIVLFPQCYRR